MVCTAAVYAPRENVRKRRNEAVRSHLKELRASIPRQPRRPSLELLEVDHLPPEAELGAVRDWRVAKRRRGLARCQGLARRQASWALPTCDMSRPVIPHMVWQELFAVGGFQEDPPRLSDQPLRRILEHRSQRWLNVPVLQMLIAREQKLNGWAGRAWPRKRTVNEQIGLAILIGPYICAPTSEKYNRHVFKIVGPYGTQIPTGTHAC